MSNNECHVKIIDSTATQTILKHYHLLTKINIRTNMRRCNLYTLNFSIFLYVWKMFDTSDTFM